jgi:uncharacterized protein GlcG (DUF336 family)
MARGKGCQAGAPMTMLRTMVSALSLVSALAILAACGGGGASDSTGVDTPPAECNGSCATATSLLTQADVERVLAQAIAEARARGGSATLAVVDRVGNVLAAYRMTGAATSVTITSGSGVTGGLEGVNIVPGTLAAIAKAVTAAYLSSEGNAFSSRTASQIVQEHFNPGESLAPGGPLFGVQFSQLPCSDLNSRFTGGAPDAGPKRSPLGLAADPGGLPLYKGGTPVGGIGVIADATYSLDRDIADVDSQVGSNIDELIALAGTFGFAAPDTRRADHITADGRSLRFSDATFADLATVPANAAAFTTLDATVGALVAVPGYGTAVTRAGVAFGQPASGIRADTLDFGGLDAFVLVDNANVERYRPRAGTEPSGALSAPEVQEILREALGVANSARAQIRRPLDSQARVTISVVDSNGVILGVVRTRDAPVFGTDVSLQKARTAAFLSSPAAAATLNAMPPAVYLDGGLAVLGSVPMSGYVDALRSFLGLPNALADGQIAITARATGNLSRPFYPDGVDGNPPGPFAKARSAWSPFSTGLELDLVYNALIQHVGFVLGVAPDVGANCTGVSGFDSGFALVAPSAAIANGLQIFAGGVPVYRGRTLVGGVGVSGDGIDQDDMIGFLAVDRTASTLGGIANAPLDMRSDNLEPSGARLRYVGCPQAPFLQSSEMQPCNGK